MSTAQPGGTEEPPKVDLGVDYRIKIPMVGRSGVGKTAFMRRFCDGKFDSSYTATVGIDFGVKTVYW